VATSLLRKKLEGRRVWLAASLLGHSAVLVVTLCFASRPAPSPEVIPISVENVNDTADFGRRLPFSGIGPVRPKTEPRLSLLRAEDAQTLVVAKVAQTPHEVKQLRTPHPLASNPSDITAGQEAPVERGELNSVVGSAQALPGRYLWNVAQTSPASAGDNVGLVEDRGGEAFKITRSTDWEANPVEDVKLRYSAPGSSLKFTVREAYSAGFAGPAFTPGFGTNLAGPTLIPGFGTNSDDNSGQFRLTAVSSGADAMATSQRLDWTLVNLKNFRVTAFGYQNEVGREFQPFGHTKKEFATAGSSTIEASLENAGPVTNLAAVQQEATNLSAVTQEAKITLDLPHLLPGTLVSSDVLSKFLPTIWVTGKDKHTPTSGQETVPADTITTSFGGTWTWNNGQATLGYSEYSSASGVAASASSGRGLDVDFGLYYSSFGFDVSLSYGNSEDIAPSWQSAGALYDSSVTVSYKPDKLPGLWASAAAGNYKQNDLAIESTALPYGSTSSDFGVHTNGEYWSITAGLDLANLFWSSEALTGQHSSVKLLYKYSDSSFLDSSAGTTRTIDDLVAMMIQRRF
jgi:hypothetical protein